MFYRLKIWYHDLIRPKRDAFIKGATHTISFVILPLLSIAFILFYGAGNPMAGSHGVEEEAIAVLGDGNDQGWVHASWSWWVLFFVRQAFLLSCVKAGEVVSIDIFALRTPIFLKVAGSFATLMIVQARGWPYIITFWALADFCFLFGSHKFANHVSEDLISHGFLNIVYLAHHCFFTPQWLYWQDWLDIFNENNPPGTCKSKFCFPLFCSS
jgi:hypothetical protein